jgi:hypothetical protein
VAFVMLVQGASGVAKDLSKMSSKSAVKLLAPTEGDGLVPLGRGADRIEERGEGARASCWAPRFWRRQGSTWRCWAWRPLAVILAVVLVSMPSGTAHGPQGREVFRGLLQIPNVNWLSAARVMLFGARDVWFVVGIPIYFYAVLSDGSEAGNRAAFFMIGTFMAVWIILYGAVQAAAPRF